jgi:hypothetical protein
VKIPEGCNMHLHTHTIWPGSYIVQTKLEIKHFKWIWENSALFPNFNDKAFQYTFDSLNGSDTIKIDQINKEVNLKGTVQRKIKTKELISEVKNTEDIHVHQNIIFNCFSPYF